VCDGIFVTLAKKCMSGHLLEMPHFLRVPISLSPVAIVNDNFMLPNMIEKE
jgi:hypothetical protein